MAKSAMLLSRARGVPLSRVLGNSSILQYSSWSFIIRSDHKQHLLPVFHNLPSRPLRSGGFDGGLLSLTVGAMQKMKSSNKQEFFSLIQYLKLNLPDSRV